MFDVFKNTFSSTVNSVSGFVGGTSTAAASEAHATNDAAEPSRTRIPRPSYSPTTTSSRATAAIDLTSSPRHKQASPPRLERLINLPEPNSTRNSQDEARPVSSDLSRPKATPLPNPLFHFWPPRDMKPGASHAPQPRNTLNQPTHRPPGTAQRTYGTQPRSSFMNFPVADDQFNSSGSPPAKKRKTGNEQSHAISVYDEGHGRKIGPESYRPVSCRSAGSGHTSLSGSRDARSEFERASAIANPHRKKSRSSIGSANSKVTNGDVHLLPVHIDDDLPGRSAKTARQEQFQGFQQGIGRTRDTSGHHRTSDLTSKFFPPKMNHSTHSAGSHAQSRVVKSENLRDFQRAPVSGTSRNGGKSTALGWPLKWARAHEYEESGEDIFLGSRVPNEYRVTSSDPNDIKLDISFKKVNQAFSDNTSRIRLMGPMNAKGARYMVDLEFADKNDLYDFARALIRSITQARLVTKSREDMKKIFAKTLDGPSLSPDTVQQSIGRDEVHNVPSGGKPIRLIDKLHSDKTEPGSQKLSRSVRAPVQGDTMRAAERPVRTTRTTQAVTLDIEDSEEEPEVEKFSQIHGLGPEWKRQLNYGSGRRRAVVDFNDLMRLDNGEFLNDQLIDFYLIYLFDQMKVPREKVYIFNTHFFTTLIRKVPGQRSQINYQGVAKWTSKEDIFGYDYIVVPINQDIHWYLAIICNVSNIARTPAIEDLTKGESESSREPNSELSTGHEAKNGKSIESIPSPALVDSPPKLPTPHAEVEVLDADESDLNVVDPRATGPGHCLNAPSISSGIEESPAGETAQLKKLSLDDSKPDGILLSGSSAMSSPKKTKRKSGPPPRKWDRNQPVVIVLDSLGGGASARSSAVRALKEYIRAEGQEKRGMEAKISQNACYAKDSQIPQQQNFSDCGVYLLGYAQKFFNNPDDFKNRLLSGEMQVQTDWPDMTMSKMRDRMREIIQRLYKEQEEKREQAKNSKKSISADSKVNTANDAIEHRPTVADKGRSRVEDSKEATVGAEMISTVMEEKPFTLSTTQPQPRLGSPSEPQSTQKRNRSRSPSVSALIKNDDSPVPKADRQETSVANSRQASPAIAVPRRSRSPMVLISKGSPVKQSPKRPLETLGVGDGPDRTASKKTRTEGKSAQSLADDEPRIVTIRSPDPKIESSIKRRSKIPLLASPRGASLPASGSSRDPIPVDDSQETPISTTGSVTRGMRRVSEEPNFIITSPKFIKGTRLAPRRQHLQAMSSPAKFSHEQGSPSARKRETSSVQHSPYVADDLDTELLQAYENESPTHLSHGRRLSKWENSTSDEETPEKMIEVPETPPHDL